MPRQWSPEQREVMRQKMLERQAQKRAGTLVVAPVPTKDEAADELKELAASLYKAADSKAERTRVMDELERFLSRLSPKDFPEIANSDVVMRFIDQMAQRKAEINKDDPPGTIYNRGTVGQYKKPWTERDLELSGMGRIEFEVAEPETVIWNGIRRDYIPGVPYNDYKCFVDTMRERTRNMRLAAEHVEYMFKLRNMLTDGSIAGIGTARIRGSADRGSYRPAAGLFEPEYSTAGGTPADE